MPKPLTVSPEAIEAADKTLQELEPRTEQSIREAIQQLAPRIEEAVKGGHYRSEINAIIARQLGCSVDIVARYETQERRRRRKRPR